MFREDCGRTLSYRAGARWQVGGGLSAYVQCAGGGVAKACEHIQEVTAVPRPHAHHAREFPTKSHQINPDVKSNYMQICGRNEGGAGLSTCSLATADVVDEESRSVCTAE